MKPLERTYNLSNADLAMFASNLVVTMNRDATELAARGVDAAAITAFESLGDSFEVFPTDDFYKGAIQIEVDAKNALRIVITEMIQNISGYVEQKWGRSSGEYKQLRIHNLQVMSESNFLVASRAVVSVANLYALDLAPIGLVQADIDALAAEAQNYEDKLNAVASAKKLREEKSRERIELANTLYSSVTEYSKIGKLVWENVNEAKYNDYIIYKTSHGGMGKVKSLAYDVPSRTASWESLQSAVEYLLEFKPDTVGAEWATAYIGGETSAVHDPGAGSWFYRCRGENESGNGDWSDELDVLLPN